MAASGAPKDSLEKQISSPHHRPAELESLHPGIHAVTTRPGDSHAAIVWEALSWPNDCSSNKFSGDVDSASPGTTL